MFKKGIHIKLSRTVRLMAQGLLLAGLAVLTLSAVSYRKHAVVRATDIRMEDVLEEHLVDRTYLKEILVKQFESDLSGVPVEYIDINNVESMFRSDPYIRDAEVFIDKKEVLQIRVKERIPLLRMMDEEKSYYLDKQGVSIPLSKQYTARMPIVFLTKRAEAALTDKKRMDLLKLINGVNAHPFTKALVDQIEVDQNWEYTILPYLGKEKIRFGSTENMNDKLENIRLFYKKQIGQGKWNTCQIIDVRFEGQIVCDQNNS